MSNVGAIQPNSSTDPWEYALAAGMSDDLPVEYADLLDPYKTRPDLLDWLAFQYSVDLWYPDWPVAKKREAVAQAAGRSILFDGEIGTLKGMRLGASRYLAQVDAQLVDAMAYPHHVYIGHFAMGMEILDHPPHKAIYLVGTTTVAPVEGYAIARDPIGYFALVDADYTPIDRAIDAVRVAKGIETEIQLDFETARVVTAGHRIRAGDGIRAGQYLPRNRLGP